MWKDKISKNDDKERRKLTDDQPNNTLLFHISLAETLCFIHSHLLSLLFDQVQLLPSTKLSQSWYILAGCQFFSKLKNIDSHRVKPFCINQPKESLHIVIFKVPAFLACIGVMQRVAHLCVWLDIYICDWERYKPCNVFKLHSSFNLSSFSRLLVTFFFIEKAWIVRSSYSFLLHLLTTYTKL